MILFFLISCTSKDNKIGMPDSDLQPLKSEIDIELTDFYSYKDSLKNYDGLYLNFGNYRNNESRVLIKYDIYPVDLYSYVSEPKLKITLNRKEFEGEIENKIEIGKLTRDWTENETTYDVAKKDSAWTNQGADFDLLDDVNYYIDEDSLFVDLSTELIEEWRTETNNGMIFIPQSEDLILEMFSRTSTIKPILTFEYRKTEEDTTVYTYSESPVKDAFITLESDFQNSRVLALEDIPPVRTVVKFNVPDSIFKDINNQQLESDMIKIITINKAELVMKKDSEEALLEKDDYLFFESLLITSDIDFNGFPVLTKDDYLTNWSMTSNSKLDSLDVIRINVTSLVQAFVREEYENKGILIRSIYENSDFNHIKFREDDVKLDIIYTIPDLKQ